MDDLLQIRRDVGGILIFDQALRIHANAAIGMIKRRGPIFMVSAGQIGFVESFGFLVLDAPDAAKVMIAIRTNGRVVRAVFGPARVVVDGGLVVEIDHVKSAIGTDARVNRAEPKIAAGDKFGFRARWIFAGDES